MWSDEDSVKLAREVASAALDKATWESPPFDDGEVWAESCKAASAHWSGLLGGLCPDDDGRDEVALLCEDDVMLAWGCAVYFRAGLAMLDECSTWAAEAREEMTFRLEHAVGVL